MGTANRRDTVLYEERSEPLAGAGAVDLVPEVIEVERVKGPCGAGDIERGERRVDGLEGRVDALHAGDVGARVPRCPTEVLGHG